MVTQSHQKRKGKDRPHGLSFNMVFLVASNYSVALTSMSFRD